MHTASQSLFSYFGRSFLVSTTCRLSTLRALTPSPATGLLILPESPRYYVKKGDFEKAITVLARVRDQPRNSPYIAQELAEIVANHQHEMQAIEHTGYLSSWTNCFRGSLWTPSSNLRRTILGISLQMMQQWTGVNFIFYFGTTFFQDLGTISNPFLISLITTLVNVCSTPISFWIIERFGRRSILLWGALGMIVCQFIVAVIGTVDGHNSNVVKTEIAFICVYIFFFATTWGPGAWVRLAYPYLHQFLTILRWWSVRYTLSP